MFTRVVQKVLILTQIEKSELNIFSREDTLQILIKLEREIQIFLVS